MNKIENSDHAIKVLKESSALLDASLLSLKISVENFIVICEMNIKPREGSMVSNIVLRIRDVKRFDFHYDSNNDFYLIDRYKLFLTANGNVYFSLDPYSEESNESENDCGVIIGKEILLQA